MKLNELKKYLKEEMLFEAPIVKSLGKGNNYQVFRVTEDGVHYTLKMNRTDVVSNENLTAEYHMLQFLEEEGIDFVQQVVAYDKKNSILLLTYIAGTEVGINGLSLKRLEVFVAQLNQLHRLSYARYQKFCKKNKLKIVQIDTPVSHLERSGVKRFNIIDQWCKEREIIEWIRPRLEANIQLVKKEKVNKKDIIFSHGDLAGANIFLDCGKMFFIDWDKARFIYNTDYYLNYIFIHGEVSKRRQKRIVELYARINKIKEEDLLVKIKERMQVTKINDIIWAVMMYVKMGKDKKYMRIADKRKKEYTEMFEKN